MSSLDGWQDWLEAPAGDVGPAVQALQALGEGDLRTALSVARAASRAAGASSAQGSCLANLVLARVRRCAGKPHLAGRIALGLARTASPRWWGWLTWEAVLAGGHPAARALEAAGAFATAAAPGGAAALALRAALDAARAGDRAGFAQTANELERVLPSPWNAEAVMTLAALDPGRAAPMVLTPWREGQVGVLPLGLDGLATHEQVRDERPLASVLAGPGVLPARVLRVGLPLLGAEVADESRWAGSQARAQTGVAVLALAGDAGLTPDTFFRAVYGFPYAPGSHRGTLDVLLHRVRGLAAAVGQLVREDERLLLRLDAVVAIPDPRCVRPIEERVFHYLARSGAVSTESAASALALPERTVRALLRQLLADGACREVRAGRHVRYQVEDTTFVAPADR